MFSRAPDGGDGLAASCSQVITPAATRLSKVNEGSGGRPATGLMSSGSAPHTGYKGLSTVQRTEVPGNWRLYSVHDIQEQVLAKCTDFLETGKQNTQRNLQGQGTAQTEGFLWTGGPSLQQKY